MFPARKAAHIHIRLFSARQVGKKKTIVISVFFFFLGFLWRREKQKHACVFVSFMMAHDIAGTGGA
jgi:cyanate permease